jgi:MFS family permease
MIILALATGLMAVGRYFAGPVIHALNPLGVLLMSAVITTLGIFLLSTTTGGMVYVATIVFALGVCYFWPTMVGVVGEYIPRTGALGMSLVGGAGLFGLSLWQPIIGGWIDANKAEAVAQGANDKAADLIAGQATLGQLMMFPAVLIVCFGVLYAMKKWISATAE